MAVVGTVFFVTGVKRSTDMSMCSPVSGLWSVLLGVGNLAGTILIPVCFVRCTTGNGTNTSSPDSPNVSGLPLSGCAGGAAGNVNTNVGSTGGSGFFVGAFVGATVVGGSVAGGGGGGVGKLFFGILLKNEEKSNGI